jgi:hypothetical protein
MRYNFISINNFRYLCVSVVIFWVWNRTWYSLGLILKIKKNTVYSYAWGCYGWTNRVSTFYSLISGDHNKNQQNWLQLPCTPNHACMIANMGLKCLTMWSYIILHPHVAYAWTTFPQSFLWKYCMKAEINLRGNNKQCWSRDRRCVYAAVWLSFRLSRSNMDVALFVSMCSCNMIHQSLELIIQMKWCASELKKGLLWKADLVDSEPIIY